jgi:hypothetical protein
MESIQAGPRIEPAALWVEVLRWRHGPASQELARLEEKTGTSVRVETTHLWQSTRGHLGCDARGHRFAEGLHSSTKSGGADCFAFLAVDLQVTLPLKDNVDFVAFQWVLSANNGARLKVSISRCPGFAVLREMALIFAAAELHALPAYCS